MERNITTNVLCLTISRDLINIKHRWHLTLKKVYKYPQTRGGRNTLCHVPHRKIIFSINQSANNTISTSAKLGENVCTAK